MRTTYSLITSPVLLAMEVSEFQLRAVKLNDHTTVDGSQAQHHKTLTLFHFLSSQRNFWGRERFQYTDVESRQLLDRVSCRMTARFSFFPQNSLTSERTTIAVDENTLPNKKYSLPSCSWKLFSADSDAFRQKVGHQVIHEYEKDRSSGSLPDEYKA